jgi:3-oxoacyl-[acyl-carrier-protein] synthase II
MLKMLFSRSPGIIPKDAFLILATTAGEIDLLEHAVLNKTNQAEESRPAGLLKKVKRLSGVKTNGLLISCACASASAAIGQAAQMIENGLTDCCLVVAADAVTEFVFSGFSSLMALDKEAAKPFDKNRSGLSLGEAAGFILLMSQARAKKEKRPGLAQICGWGLSCDANHMTGPARNGQGLIQAITKALKKAGLAKDKITGISGHGTGTLYNDAMELTAFKHIFNNKPVPLYSVKGAIGHTLGAAGLIETIVAVKALQEKTVPPTIGLKDIDEQASGWAAATSRKIKPGAIMLDNCGFGGVNSVLIIKNIN